MGKTRRLVKAFSDAVPHGDYQEPHLYWINVRLDFVQDAIVHFDQLEHGIYEWSDEAKTAKKQAELAMSTAKLAICHLQNVLNNCRNHSEQQSADIAARDWLASIGN